MSYQTTAPRMTVREFLLYAEESDGLHELSDGLVLREPHPSAWHGRLSTIVAQRLREHVAQGAGEVLTNAGFVLSDERATVRAPDVAFVARADLARDLTEDGFWPGAPDLAVEISSPSNTASWLQLKVVQYLDAGVRLIWVIDRPTRSAMVYRSASEIRLLRGEEVLDGGDVLPGFRLTLRELFGD